MKKLSGLLLATLALVAACNKGKNDKPKIQTATIGRQTIRLDAEATGAVEPINVVEVKSKASGLITKMTVETGNLVKPGDLLVQIDTRDVQNQYNQSEADARAARENLNITSAQKKRSDDLFTQKIITAPEHEAAVLAFSNAQAQVVRTEASLDLAKQRLE
ncbi:MAG: HlyD family secretion protein, partial [Gemmatimonadota bacterium]|nr:HlyD family secretion protein [Gemmatimonadota bacterium]